MNQRIMEDAIGQHVPLPEKGEQADARRAERAAAYLEKLCQNVWHLPMVPNPRIYLLKQMPNELKTVCSWIDAAVGHFRCLPPNPRRLKGLANLLVRFANYLPQRHGSKNNQELIREARLMLIVAYVYQFHHDLFRLWESDYEVHGHLLDWTEGVTVEPEQPGADRPLFSILRRLHRAEWIEREPTGPVPKFNYESAFPDPTDTSVFWIQRLIHEAASDAKQGKGSVDGETYEPYLRGIRRPF